MQNRLGRLGGQLGVALCLVGFVVLFFGWNGAASTGIIVEQFPYLISGGMVGLALVVIGAAMVVVQNQRADRVRLEEALDRVAAAVDSQAGAQGGGGNGVGLPGYVLAGSMSYHQVHCTLVEAREEARLVPLQDIVGSALTPCRVCRPPQFGRLEASN